MSVNQLAFLVFVARAALAKYHYNDVIKALQGPLSLHPKWLEQVTLGFAGVVARDEKLKRSKVSKLHGEVGLTCLLKVKFDANLLSPDKTEALIVECWKQFIGKAQSFDEGVKQFYLKCKPVIAFKVQDTHTKKCFFDVTNVAVDLKERKMKIKKNASKPDVVNTKTATKLRETDCLKHVRDLANVLDDANVDFLKESQYVPWGDKIANLSPVSDSTFKEIYTKDKQKGSHPLWFLYENIATRYRNAFEQDYVDFKHGKRH